MPDKDKINEIVKDILNGETDRVSVPNGITIQVVDGQVYLKLDEGIDFCGMGSSLRRGRRQPENCNTIDPREGLKVGYPGDTWAFSDLTHYTETTPDITGARRSTVSIALGLVNQSPKKPVCSRAIGKYIENGQIVRKRRPIGGFTGRHIWILPWGGPDNRYDQGGDYHHRWVSEQCRRRGCFTIYRYGQSSKANYYRSTGPATERPFPAVENPCTDAQIRNHCFD